MTLLDNGGPPGVGGQGGGNEIADILSMAASASLPQPGQLPQNATTMGPAPLQPPTPQPRLQMPQATYPKAGNSFGSVGERKRADKQALFSTIANMVKAGGDYVQAKKNRALQTNISRLMDAQEGLTEAQDILKQNPNDENAKKAIAHNTAIINDITADPKINKQLQKAFNIDLFGGGKNKNENKALMDAWGEFNKKKQGGDQTALNPVAQRLMQQQPMRMQMSPELQQQAQLIKSGILPKAGEILKARTELAKLEAQAKTAEDKIAVQKEHDRIIEENAKLIAGAKDKMTEAYISRTTLMGTNASDRNKVLVRVAQIKSHDNDMRIDAMKQIASGRNDVQMARIKSLEKIAGDKNKTLKEKNAAQMELNKLKYGQTILGSMAKQYDEYNKQYKNLAEENAKNQTEIDKKGSSIFGFKMSAADRADIMRMKDKITTNNAIMNTLDGQMKEMNGRMQKMQEMGLLGATNLSAQQDPENLFPGDSSGVDDSDEGGMDQ